MPAAQRKCIYGGLTLDVDRHVHYIGSVTATTHQEKGIITLELNPSQRTVLLVSVKPSPCLLFGHDLGDMTLDMTFA